MAMEIARVTPEVIAPLTADERTRLVALEGVVQDNLAAAERANDALLEIHDSGLWREYDSWYAYLRARWPHAIKKSRSYQVLDELRELRRLEEAKESTMVDLPTEASGRALRAMANSGLTPQERVEAYADAARANGGQAPTGRQVEAAIAERQGAKPDASSGDEEERAAAFMADFRAKKESGEAPRLEMGSIIVARGKDEILKAAKELRIADRQEKREAREERHRAIAAGNRDLAFGDRRFAVVFPDCPWSYDNTTNNGAALGHYPTMSLQEICELPVGNIVTEDAVCFLWVPVPLAREGFTVLDAWGFEYKTQRVWLKPRRNGLGHYTFVDHELIYIGTRGSMVPLDREASWFEAPKDAHSAKPEEPYLVAQRMYPGGPYLEMFAREAREGWDAWGNQAEEE